MIAVPVSSLTPTSKDPAAAAEDGATGTMNSADEWPSLAASHGQTSPSAEEAQTALASGNGDDWEMLSPAESISEDHHTTTATTADDGDEVVVIRPTNLRRKNSISAPDLRELEAQDENDDDVSSSVVMVPDPASVAAESSSVVVVSNPWTSKNKVSFKDAILTPSKYIPEKKKALHSHSNPPTKQKNKVKSRYVVTPIRRCAKSTGDLLSLVHEEEEEDEEGGSGAVMGETDAMEYYHRKAHGAHGRSNGLKQRPDEAKRKEMIVQKKNLQRQQQKKGK